MATAPIWIKKCDAICQWVFSPPLDRRPYDICASFCPFGSSVGYIGPSDRNFEGSKYFAQQLMCHSPPRRTPLHRQLNCHNNRRHLSLFLYDDIVKQRRRRGVDRNNVPKDAGDVHTHVQRPPSFPHQQNYFGNFFPDDPLLLLLRRNNSIVFFSFDLNWHNNNKSHAHLHTADANLKEEIRSQDEQFFFFFLFFVLKKIDTTHKKKMWKIIYNINWWRTKLHVG